MNRGRVGCTILCCTIFFIAGGFAAQVRGDDAPAKAVNLDPAQWNIDAMIKRAADNVCKRYNCNDKQRELTHAMFEEGVNRFIRDHQDEIWPLLRELWPYQVKGENPDPETAKRIAQRLLPLIEEAQKAIHASNDVWRETLTAEQRRLYDFDRAQLDSVFEEMRTNYKKWRAGEVVNQPIFPKARNEDKAPKDIPRPPDGFLPPQRFGEVPTRTSNAEALKSAFQRYVDQFIADYKLDATQIDAAKSILREIEARAASHMLTNKSKLGELSTKLQKARAETDQQRIRQLNDEIEAVNAPILTMFDELKSRLDKIPTDAQRKQFEESKNKGSAEPEAPAQSQEPAAKKAKAAKGGVGPKRHRTSSTNVRP